MLAVYFGLLALSAGSLMYELALTRIFAVAQGYHFAFLAVSLAMLGFGASGAWLAQRRRQLGPAALAPLSAAGSLGILASYLVTNCFPYDAYAIAWDARQVVLLAADYLALTVPFFFAGLVTGLALSLWPGLTPRLYAASLAGSAAGAVTVLAALPAAGGEGTVCVAAALLGAGGVAFGSASAEPKRRIRQAWLAVVPVLMLILAVWRPALLQVRLSPYKPLAHALRYPGAHIAYERWNAYSRVDVVESAGIHSAPGLSLRYVGPLPQQYAVAIDGGDLSPITKSPGVQEDTFLSAVQSGLPYQLRPSARVLLIDPRGGLDLLAALRLGANRVAVIAPNALVLNAVRYRYADYSGGIYDDPRVDVRVASARAFLASDRDDYDLVVFSLPQAFRAVTAGSYSLGETYVYTTEAFEAALRRLSLGGILVAQAWLQSPPTETVRLLVTIQTALRRLRPSADPATCIVAYRDWSLMTILVRTGPFAASEISTLQRFCSANAFDVVTAPGRDFTRVPRFHSMADPEFERAHLRVLDPAQLGTFVAHYPYDVSPATDERPFFNSTFRWVQLATAWRAVGRSAEPFGGGGYLILLALLGMAVLVSAGLSGYAIARARGQGPGAPALLYFLLIGAAYIGIELVLMQRSVLLLEQPTYAFAAVLATLLLASGLGSRVSSRVPLVIWLGVLTAVVCIVAVVWPLLASALLGQALLKRVAVTIAVVALLGVLMGAAFPAGLVRLTAGRPQAIAAAWAINGCASVVGSIVATLATLSAGFGWVLAAAGVCYMLAGCVVAMSNRGTRGRVRDLRR